MSDKVELWDASEIARKWRALAERRRAHFIELYRSGRWRRYFTDHEFLTSVRNVTADIEFWDELVGREELPVLRKAG
jgi:uncharacterized repeat protein (TIGR03809 family)